MGVDRIICKALAVAVILLFIGLAVQPSIAVKTDVVNVEYYNVNVELFGLGENHTVQLTQQQLDELELIFETLREQLNNTKSKEEIIQIYNKAIERLDDIELLGDYSVKEIQELVTGRFRRPIFNILVNGLFDKINYDNGTNSFCLISGRTSNTGFNIPLHTIRFFIIHWTSGFYLLRFRVFLQFYSPLVVGSIHFGYSKYDYFTEKTTYYPASGWVETSGLNGRKTWDQPFYGQIFSFHVDWFPPYDYNFYVGVVGFTGIKIYNYFIDRYYYLGFACYVKTS